MQVIRLNFKRCVLAVSILLLLLMLWNNGRYQRRRVTLRRNVYKTLSEKNGVHENIRMGFDTNTGTCNINLCNPVRDDRLNVHLISHTHDDPGWLRTIHQYYTGENAPDGDKNPDSIRSTLNTTIRELLKNPKRKAIFIEMSFFTLYWNEIDNKAKEVIRDLVKQRRLEFILGGWCMSDSATTFYNDIIDQLSLGFDFISQNFGPCAQSRTAWHVDQFGHSREHSSILAQMGFDALVAGRIHSHDLYVRTHNKTREMVWQSSPDNLGDKATLFTHILDSYHAPNGYIFEGWPPDKMKSYNLKGFVSAIEKKKSSFRTNHVMIPMGRDFGYKHAEQWFGNIDILIERIHNEYGDKYHLFYSTPSCYIHHVNKEIQTWPTKADDFFPYRTFGYWTGFYTSKGGLKLHVKKAGALLQACKQLSVLAGLGNVFRKVHVLKAAVGVLQHHDAITGTEKEHVVKDYNKMLSDGESQCQDVLEQAYAVLSPTQDNSLHTFCPKLNISECPISTSSEKMLVVVYNPLSRNVTSWIRFPVSHAQYTVTRGNGNIPVQVLPISEMTSQIPERHSTATAEVVFNVHLPAMGFVTYLVKRGSGGFVRPLKSLPVLPLVIENEHLAMTFGTDGLMSKILNKEEGVDILLRHDFAFYTSMRSGAYIFSTHSAEATPLLPNVGNIRVYKGDLVTEVHQTFGSFVSQVTRLYENSGHLELEWTVGPIPVDEQSKQGKEVISRFTSDIKNMGDYYTDSNGREHMLRKRRENETGGNKASGNYYPVTSRIFIKDKERDVEMTVLTDRSQGGGSIRDGQLELMIHRRVLTDDNLGVAEPLNERGVDGKGLILRGKHYLYVGSQKKSTKFRREKAFETHFNPTISFVKLDSNNQQFDFAGKNMWSALTSDLPANVHILSLEHIRDDDGGLVRLRLEHFYEKGEHPELSQQSTVNLEGLFRGFSIVGIEEASLGGNFNLSDIRRLRWRTDSGLTPEHIGAENGLNPDFPLLITLQPMEIRTFHLQLERNVDTFSFFRNIIF